MVKLDKIYTRGGDAGETSLGDGARVAKSSARIAAIGDVDEANCALGLARLHLAGAEDAALARLQNDLFDLGADLCLPITEATQAALRITETQVEWLETQIDRLNGALPALQSFVLPGGTPAAAFLHQARAVTRRAERMVVTLVSTPDEAVNRLVLAYLNRLSDLLFVMARHVNALEAGDVLWVPGGGGESV